jgi:hypothetical protein
MLRIFLFGQSKRHIAPERYAIVDINPYKGVVSDLAVDYAQHVTVTVSKEITGVGSIYTTASYDLDLYYGEGMAVFPAAVSGSRRRTKVHEQIKSKIIRTGEARDNNRQGNKGI